MSRAFSGSSFTERLLTTAPSWVLVVSTSGASEVTSTTSCAAAQLHRHVQRDDLIDVERDALANILLKSSQFETKGVGANGKTSGKP